MKVNGIFEIAINVKNLEESTKFYKNVLGLKDGLLQEERRWNFLWIDDRKGMIVLIEENETFKPLHFAFSVEKNNLETLSKKVLEAGYSISEPTNHDWMNATSIYFQDPNGHDLEFIVV
jgi:lactoylglutathione lyase